MSKQPINRLDSPKMAGICIFCTESDECYSTPKECREREKSGDINDT